MVLAGAQRELSHDLKTPNQKRIHNELIAKKIEWIFSPPLNPWMNGAVEVVVKLTTRRLKAITRDRLFNERSPVNLSYCNRNSVK